MSLNILRNINHIKTFPQFFVFWHIIGVYIILFLKIICKFNEKLSNEFIFHNHTFYSINILTFLKKLIKLLNYFLLKLPVYFEQIFILFFSISIIPIDATNRNLRGLANVSCLDL